MTEIYIIINYINLTNFKRISPNSLDQQEFEQICQSMFKMDIKTASKYFNYNFAKTKPSDLDEI